MEDLKEAIETQERLIQEPITIIFQGKEIQISWFKRESSDPSGKNVVFFHGLGDSSLDFVDAANQNSMDSHALIGFDFPGCGNSPTVKDLGNL